MSTLLQLVNDVLRRTGQMEVSTLVNAQSPVSQACAFLNETYTDMLQRLKAQQLMRQDTLTTSSGISQYNLATDAESQSLIADSVVETASQQRLTEADYTYPLTHDLTATGRPCHFYRAGNELCLYPIPNGAYSIQYRYFISPAPLVNDADTPDIPASWETILLIGAQARLEKFLGEEAEETYLLYREGVDQLKSQSATKPHNRMQGFYRGNA